MHCPRTCHIKQVTVIFRTIIFLVCVNDQYIVKF